MVVRGYAISKVARAGLLYPVQSGHMACWPESKEVKEGIKKNLTSVVVKEVLNWITGDGYCPRC